MLIWIVLPLNIEAIFTLVKIGCVTWQIMNLENIYCKYTGFAPNVDFRIL